MMFGEKFDVYGDNGGATGQYDFDSEIVNHKKIISNLEKLKSMRQLVIQDMKKNEDDFFPKINSFISDWEGQYPNLRKMFSPTEIDWLLIRSEVHEDVISFVIKSGYKDEPELDEDGKPLLNRSTPLLYAVNNYMLSNSCVRKLFEIYDRFDVNYIDEYGSTHFHVACKYGLYDIVQKFLKLRQNPNFVSLQSVENYDSGPVKPPLHMALDCNHRKVVELLLKNGADPNLATAHGSTPLHMLCDIENYDTVVWFFEVNKQLKQPVLVDARDKLGRTPLQWAVARLSPRFVDVLLVNGADLSNFVFPDDSYFGVSWIIHLELTLASRALFIVERLENEGYELDRSDAFTIMKLFAKRGLFEYSMDLIQDMRSDEEFMNRAIEMKIKDNDPNLSLYDLIQLRPEEAAKRITCADLMDFTLFEICIGKRHKKACIIHLFETISRRFCRRWALDSLLKLTQHKQPTLCSEIIDHLPNEYLWRIFSATTDENSR